MRSFKIDQLVTVGGTTWKVRDIHPSADGSHKIVGLVNPDNPNHGTAFSLDVLAALLDQQEAECGKYDHSPTAELEDIAGYFADAFRNRSASDLVNRAGDLAEVHEIALVLNARYDAAAETRVLNARIAMIKPWMPITIGGDVGQTGTIIVERDADTGKILKAKTWLWQPGTVPGPSFGRWADLLTEHWFLPAPTRTVEHMRTLDARFLGEQLGDSYLKGGPLYTAAIEELYDRAVFEAKAREQSDDEWTRGMLAAADAWSRPWPGESA